MTECREITDAIIEDDQKQIDKIIEANKSRTEPYWIVMFVKPCKGTVEGKPALAKVIKAYASKPAPQVGMITAEVDNQKGTVEWDINMPDVPFDFDALPGEKNLEVVADETSIPNAYVTA